MPGYMLRHTKWRTLTQRFFSKMTK
jgi:hypothetical protein